MGVFATTPQSTEALMARSTVIKSKPHQRRKLQVTCQRRKKNNKRGRKGARRKPVRSKSVRRDRNQNRPWHGLIDAVGEWLPGQFFSRWKVARGCKWSPQRLFWIAILIALAAAIGWFRGSFQFGR